MADNQLCLKSHPYLEANKNTEIYFVMGYLFEEFDKTINANRSTVKDAPKKRKQKNIKVRK